jgi:hypothetical protein
VLGFHCDCSVDCESTLEWWGGGWVTATSRPAVWCCECGRWIRPGEHYHWFAGVDREELEDLDYFDCHDCEELADCDQDKVQEWTTCLGCKRIADRFCPGGYYLGQLDEAVAECLEFRYTEDPDDWDDEEVDEEDAANRAFVLARQSASDSGSSTMHHQRFAR